MSSLQSEWPDLRIVGEEDGAASEAGPGDKRARAEAGGRARLAGLGQEEVVVPLAEVRMVETQCSVQSCVQVVVLVV